MNIVFLKLYITEDVDNKFYNSQEIGLARAICKAHPEHRVDIILLSKRVSTKQKYDVSARISVHTLPARGFGHHGFINLHILDELKADYVHLLADNMIFAPNVIKYCSKNWIGCHLYIGTLFSDSSKWYKQAISKFLMMRNIKVYRKAKVYTKTPKVLEQCKNYGIDAKLAPVGLPEEAIAISDRNIEDIRKEYGLPGNKKILLFVGRLESYKHPLDSVELLNCLGNDYHLCIVGKGELLSEVEARIIQYNLDGRVTILSQVPNTQMRDLFKACDYYVNFNPDEIYGMAILEAMSHECLVLAIKAAGPEFLIENGTTGFICSSVEEMADRVVEINSVEGNFDVDKMLNMARNRVLDKFTWEKTRECFDCF